MGKRSEFRRLKADCYDTFDPKPVERLLPFLHGVTTFVEPCAGRGDLKDQLEDAGLLCTLAMDKEPRADGIYQMDALDDWERGHADVIITNPPWTRVLLHEMIIHFQKRSPHGFCLILTGLLHSSRNPF